MTDTLTSVFFAAGIAGFTYTKMGKRLGYGNTQRVGLIVAIAFILSFIVFYTLLDVVFNIH